MTRLLSRRRPLVVVGLAAALLAGAHASTAVPDRDADDVAGVTALGRTPYTGGTELAYDGSRYLYAGSYDGITSRGSKRGEGGVRVFDTKGKAAKQVAFIACSGNDNDVEVVRPGLLAIGWHTNSCGEGHGLRLYDVKDPRRPKPLGLVKGLPSSHTISVHPDRRHVYVSPGGLQNGGGVTSIVDTADPRGPKVVGTFTPNPLGCHDLSFTTAKQGRTLAVCAGGGEVQVWDVADPKAPRTIGRVVNPLIQFPHYAMVSPDGGVLIVNDEAFAAHGCVAGASPHGALSFYDFTTPEAPVPLGRFAPQRGAQPVGDDVNGTPSWCTSHQFNLVPGTRKLVLAWFTGGTSVIDYSDPLLPVEYAHYLPEGANTYSAHFFGGKVYANDKLRGLETLSVPGITSAAPAPRDLPALLPARPKLRLADLGPGSRGPVSPGADGPELFCRR